MKRLPSPPPVYSDNETLKMLNRLSFTDFVIIILIYLESLLSFILRLIPRRILNLFTSIINFTANIDDTKIEDRLRSAPTIHEMCDLFNILVEDHLVRTEDNYILTLHRIPPCPGKFNGKVVYLHHGLLMCSDVWCCQVERHKNLPFLLHDLGYDVWMGNNRGNKYSTAHLYHPPKSAKFWDFSIDEFAFFDIPNSIDFIVDYCNVEQVICIGFSQGSAQMFAAFSVNEKLNSKVSHLIAIAPAMTPKRLYNIIADTFAKSSPRLMYLFFGRNIVLPSAIIWQRSTHPHVFSILIDACNRFLFNWKSNNITPIQKEICFAKLYSTTSVKSIVHWFQILRSQKFQMFEESDDMFNSLTRPYQIATFPTRTNIKIPILLIYGTNDLLVDIKVMKKNLPPNSVFDIKVDNHEHLDLIWSNDVDKLVFNKVIKFIDFFSIMQDDTDNKTQNNMIPSSNATTTKLLLHNHSTAHHKRNYSHTARNSISGSMTNIINPRNRSNSTFRNSNYNNLNDSMIHSINTNSRLYTINDINLNDNNTTTTNISSQTNTPLQKTRSNIESSNSIGLSKTTSNNSSNTTRDGNGHFIDHILFEGEKDGMESQPDMDMGKQEKVDQMSVGEREKDYTYESSSSNTDDDNEYDNDNEHIVVEDNLTSEEEGDEEMDTVEAVFKQDRDSYERNKLRRRQLQKFLSNSPNKYYEAKGDGGVIPQDNDDRISYIEEDVPPNNDDAAFNTNTTLAETCSSTGASQ